MDIQNNKQSRLTRKFSNDNFDKKTTNVTYKNEYYETIIKCTNIEPFSIENRERSRSVQNSQLPIEEIKSQEKIFTKKRNYGIKNKFLEKENIQINEERMRKLLSERKMQTKLRNKPNISNTRNKTVKNNGVIAYVKINEDTPDNSSKIISNDSNNMITFTNFTKNSQNTRIINNRPNSNKTVTVKSVKKIAPKPSNTGNKIKESNSNDNMNIKKKYKNPIKSSFYIKNKDSNLTTNQINENPKKNMQFFEVYNRNPKHKEMYVYNSDTNQPIKKYFSQKVYYNLNQQMKNMDLIEVDESDFFRDMNNNNDLTFHKSPIDSTKYLDYNAYHPNNNIYYSNSEVIYDRNNKNNNDFNNNNAIKVIKYTKGNTNSLSPKNINTDKRNKNFNNITGKTKVFNPKEQNETYFVSHGKNNDLYTIEVKQQIKGKDTHQKNYIYTNNNSNTSRNNNIRNNNNIKEINEKKNNNNNLEHKSKNVKPMSLNNVNNINNYYTNINMNMNVNVNMNVGKKMNTNFSLSPIPEYGNIINSPIPINYIDHKKDVIQIEDLLILEGKLWHLLESLRYEKPMPKMCVEWWSFYTFSSFYGKFPKLFQKTKKLVDIDEEGNLTDNNSENTEYQVAHDLIILELISVILTYDVLNDADIDQNIISVIKTLVGQIYQNFLIECDYILTKLNNQSLSNIWINKLRNIISAKKKYTIVNNNHLNVIKMQNTLIKNNINLLLNTYSDSNIIDVNAFNYFLKNINKIHLAQLNQYFSKVINKDNIKISKTVTYSIKTRNNKNESKITFPYLPQEKEGNKNYTLVLDLDETLVSFRFDDNNQGILKMRPGLKKFLAEVNKKYEVVVFTAGTQEYADPILDIIEKDEKFFVKRLYRQHAVIINNIYVKDLTKLGRDLSKIIIIDNMPQNFLLQKDNGIFIKNFFGQDQNDTALIDLIPILLNIASKPNNDVRKELKKYKEEIFTKITTNLK